MTVIAALTTSLIPLRQEPTTKESAPALSKRDDSAAEKLGWRIGVCASSFRDRTAFDAIDSAAKLGIKYIELQPGQALSADKRDVKVGPDMTDDQVASLRAKLDSAHVKAASFGDIVLTHDEAPTRKVFELARKLGAETITCDPDNGTSDLLDKLCDEYKIGIAIHNDLKPSRFWKPEFVMLAIEHQTRRQQACADPAQWKRSGVDPIPCLKFLEGHISVLRFKTWGMNRTEMDRVLGELVRQHFKGLITIECEDGQGSEIDANVARCVASIDEKARLMTSIPVVVDESSTVETDWYQDAFRRDEGGNLAITVKRLDDGSIDVMVFSRESRKTSGISLDIRIAKDEHDALRALVHGSWWRDFGTTRDGVREGVADPTGGKITLSSADLAHARPLYLKFELATRWSGAPKTVSGGIRVVE